MRLDPIKSALGLAYYYVNDRWHGTAEDRDNAYTMMSSLLDFDISAEDRELVYAGRWHIDAVWGEPNYKLDLLDIIDELLSDDPSHVDGGALPEPEAEPTPEEREIDLYQPPVNGKEFQGVNIALCPGHNKRTGGRAIDGDDEWTTRKDVILTTASLLADLGFNARIFIRNPKLSYGQAMREHGRKFDRFESVRNIEWHFNLGGGNGCEFIVGSKTSAKVYKKSAANFASCYDGELKTRRDDGIYYRTTGRGLGFCRAGKGASVVGEPCFADDHEEWLLFDNQIDKEAKALTGFIVNSFADV